MAYLSRKFKIIAVAFSTACLLSGCTPTGKDVFLQVELCVNDEQGLALFKSTLQSVAQTEGMRFIDGSAQTQRDLENLDKKTPLSFSTEGTVNIGVEGQDGMGLLAGNLGLPRYKMAVGFWEGKDAPKARAFAQRTVDRLKTQWTVDTVPNDRGSRPMKSCNGDSNEVAKPS